MLSISATIIILFLLLQALLLGQTQAESPQAVVWTSPVGTAGDFSQQFTNGQTLAVGWNEYYNNTIYGTSWVDTTKTLVSLWVTSWPGYANTHFSSVIKTNVNMSTSGTTPWLIDIPNNILSMDARFHLGFYNASMVAFDDTAKVLSSPAFIVLPSASSSSTIAPSSSVSSPDTQTSSSSTSSSTSTSLALPNTSSQSSSSPGLSTGAKAGIGIGCALVGLLLVTSSGLFWLRKNKGSAQEFGAQYLGKSEMEGRQELPYGGPTSATKELVGHWPLPYHVGQGSVSPHELSPHGQGHERAEMY